MVLAPTATGMLTERAEREDAPVSLSLSMQPLVDHFNAGRGKPRFVAILSSTCPPCVFGAQAVKASVLDAYPDADIQVSIVWIDMLQSDNEGAALKLSGRSAAESIRVPPCRPPNRSPSSCGSTDQQRSSRTGRGAGACWLRGVRAPEQPALRVATRVALFSSVHADEWMNRNASGKEGLTGTPPSWPAAPGSR